MKAFKSVTALIEAWCLWMTVTSIGWLVGYSLVGYLAHIASFGISNQAAFVVSVVCGGGILALVQWQYLGPKVGGIATWAVVSACGLMLGFAVTTFTFSLIGSLLGSTISGALGGLVLGFVQWFSLRSDPRDKIAWILMTTLGWALASGLGMLVFARGEIASLPSTFQEIVGSWTIGSVMVSLVTVLAVVMLFPKSTRKDPRLPTRWSF